MPRKINDAVYEKRYVTKSGEIRWVRNSVTALNDSEGRLANFAALTEDITEWRNSRRAMQTGNDRTRRLVECMHKDEVPERRHIAADLEGSTMELMAAITQRLSKLKESSALNEAENYALSEGVALAGRFVDYMSALAHILSPPTPASAEFQNTLSDYVQLYTARTGIAVAVEFSGGVDTLEPKTATVAFSAAKQALAEFEFLSYAPVSGVAMSVRREQASVVVQVEGESAGFGSESIDMARLRHEIRAAGGCAELSLAHGRACFRALIPAGDSV
jgi:signal transduction histidine kinase